MELFQAYIDIGTGAQIVIALTSLVTTLIAYLTFRKGGKSNDGS